MCELHKYIKIYIHKRQHPLLYYLLKEKLKKKKPQPPPKKQEKIHIQQSHRIVLIDQHRSFCSFLRLSIAKLSKSI